MRRIPRIAFVLVLAAAAACTAQPDSNHGIASAGGVTTTSPGPVVGGGNYDPINWVKCLREHGITVDDPILVDPTPTLRVSSVSARVPSPAGEVTIAVIHRYRIGLRFATCMTGLGLGVLSSPGGSGVPEYEPDPDAERDHHAEVERCRVEADARERESVAPNQVKECQEAALKHLPAESEIPSRDPPAPTDLVWPTEESTELPFPSGVKVDLPLYDCLQKAFRNSTKDIGSTSARSTSSGRPSPPAR